MVHDTSLSMGYICDTYRLNQSYRHGATEPLSRQDNNFEYLVRPWFITTRATEIFGLLTWKWGATQRNVMGYIFAKYKANPSDRHGAKERTWQKLGKTPVALTFDLSTRNPMRWMSSVSFEFHENLMIGTWWNRCDKQTNRRTDVPKDVQTDRKLTDRQTDT